MTRFALLICLGLTACSDRAAVGAWAGQTQFCDDAALDGTSVNISISVGTEEEADFGLITNLATPDESSCTSEVQPVDPDEHDFDVTQDVTCGTTVTSYDVAVSVTGDSMTGTIAWDGGGCDIELSRAL